MPPLCRACRHHVLSVFKYGFATAQSRLPVAIPKRSPFRGSIVGRSFASSTNKATKKDGPSIAKSNRTEQELYIEVAVRTARATYGNTLPRDLLDEAELAEFERLFEKPTLVEDHEIMEEDGPLDSIEELGEQESNDRGLVFDSQADFDEYIKDRDVESFRLRKMQEEADIAERFERSSPVQVYRSQVEESSNEGQILEEDDATEDNDIVRDGILDRHKIDVEDYYPTESDMDADGVSTIREHPLTTLGRWGTEPSTIFLPNESFIGPVADTLAVTKSEHITQAAHKLFGGQFLPDSAATPVNHSGLRQKPMPIEVSSPSMSEAEASAYLAANSAGVYASATSILVEIRKRLGSLWLEELFARPKGPRILDAGSAGIGVMAWREILQAEHARMVGEGSKTEHDTPNLGESTVVVGSHTLRNRISTLLDDTTFIPRLPDYNPRRDLAAPQEGESPSRKQYDVILAPYMLWTIKEDYMRKAMVQNLWSLLDPNGGVLIILEKGLPRGFELVAGAREVLLKNHISSPGFETIENEISSPTLSRYSVKEEGMIIAPCTNHTKCPMYLAAGESRGRKDYCNFVQRFQRPAYLQRIVNDPQRVHEDIRFSYVAVRRGKDSRKTNSFEQNEEITKAAFTGYEDSVNMEGEVTAEENYMPHALTFPRIIGRPLKRHRHVSIDVCTPAGQFERWTTTKTWSKQGYRDARKSQWGDLWALGAKVRVPSTAKTGRVESARSLRKANNVTDGVAETYNIVRHNPLAAGSKKKMKNRFPKRPRDNRVPE